MAKKTLVKILKTTILSGAVKTVNQTVEVDSYVAMGLEASGIASIIKNLEQEVPETKELPEKEKEQETPEVDEEYEKLLAETAKSYKDYKLNELQAFAEEVQLDETGLKTKSDYAKALAAFDIAEDQA